MALRAYPYAAGLRWHIEVVATGQRLRQMEFKGRNDRSWAPLDMDKTYRLVTNNYIAAGRDGYLTFKTVKNGGRYTDTILIIRSRSSITFRSAVASANCRHLIFNASLMR